MNVLEKQKTFLDFFPTPEFLLLSTTGITITDTDVKFMQLRRKVFGRGCELAHVSKVNLSQGVVVSGVVKQFDELVTILKKLSSHYHIRYARATLPEEQTYLFTTTIPRVASEGLKDAVAFIIEENVPMSLAESIFDFTVIGNLEDSPTLKLAVSVVSKNVVDSYIRLFESADITPISFDLESQAIARSVIRRGDRQSTLIVNIASNKTGFYVVEEEVVQFSTTSAYPLVDDVSLLNVNDLRGEMAKILTFWNSRTDKFGTSEKTIEKIIFYGLMSDRVDFVALLMNDHSIPYSTADVWQNVSSSKEVVSDIPLHESLDYASAIGLQLF
jgi:hypothetical protein